MAETRWAGWKRMALWVAAVLAAARVAHADVPYGYGLTFADEFDGDAIDRSKWNTGYLPSGPYARTLCLAYAADDAFELEDGAAHLRLDDRALGGREYTSGSLDTNWGPARFSQQYGFFEARTRSPEGSGISAAFWLLPVDERYYRLVEDGGTRAHASEAFEIDIFEHRGAYPRWNLFSAHHGIDDGPRRSTSYFELVDGPDFTAGYHTVSVEWTTDRILWRLDDREVFQSPNAPQDPFFIIVNLYYGCGWTGVPTVTEFPRYFDVDYVRAYAKGSTRRNLALLRPASATSSRADLHPRTADLAVDGDTTTRWWSADGLETELVVDLGRPYVLDEVLLEWEARYATRYSLEVASEGGPWRSVAEVAGGDGGTDVIVLPSTPARYVRVVMHEAATGEGYSLWELRAHEAPVGAVDAGPMDSGVESPDAGPMDSGVESPDAGSDRAFEVPDAGAERAVDVRQGAPARRTGDAGEGSSVHADAGCSVGGHGGGLRTVMVLVLVPVLARRMRRARTASLARARQETCPTPPRAPGAAA